MESVFVASFSPVYGDKKIHIIYLRIARYIDTTMPEDECTR